MPLDDDARRKAAETKRQRTVRAILDAVGVLMAESRPMTVAAVAAEAGVSQATIYRYFPTKDDLHHAWFVEAVEQALDFTAGQPTALDLLAMQMVNIFESVDPEGLQLWRSQLRRVLDNPGTDRHALAMQLVRALLNFVPRPIDSMIPFELPEGFDEWGGLEGRKASSRRRRDAS